MKKMQSLSDEYFINLALQQAEIAQKENEIPVGAILVIDQEIIAQSGNKTIQKHDPTAHAEIECLRKAGQLIANHRLVNAELFITLEPCLMCVGAILQARLKRVVFGAFDNKSTGISAFLQQNYCNHSVLQVKGGVLEQECRQILQQFFQQKRQKLKD